MAKVRRLRCCCLSNRINSCQCAPCGERFFVESGGLILLFVEHGVVFVVWRGGLRVLFAGREAGGARWLGGRGNALSAAVVGPLPLIEIGLWQAMDQQRRTLRSSRALPLTPLASPSAARFRAGLPQGLKTNATPYSGVAVWKVLKMLELMVFDKTNIMVYVEHFFQLY